MNEIKSLEIIASSTLPASDKVSALIEAFLSGRNALTIKAYRQDLESFALFLAVRNIAEASQKLLSSPPGDANALVLSYRSRMTEKGLSPATINRRMASIRALVKLARTLGIVAWKIEIGNVKGTGENRDLRGPGRTLIAEALRKLEATPGGKARRDAAILRLLHDLGLRRGEVISLDVEHLNLEAGTVDVLGKGRAHRTSLTLPEPTKTALMGWLAVRGDKAGPLFTNFDRAHKGSRLTGRSLHRLTIGLGLGRPHGIRHSAITEALDMSHGNIRAVQRFSRHKDVRIISTYDDNRQDLGGQMARQIATGL